MPRRPLTKKERKAKLIRVMKSTFLAQMREGNGIKVAAGLAGVSIEKVAYHRKVDKSFAEAVSEIMDRPDHRERLRKRDAVVVPSINDQWQRVYLRKLKDGKSRVEAADEMGISVLDVQKEMEENSGFSRSLEEVRVRKLMSIEDAQWERARKNSADAKFLLGKMMPDTYGVKANGKAANEAAVEGGHFTAEGLANADKWLESMAHAPSPLHLLKNPD